MNIMKQKQIHSTENKLLVTSWEWYGERVMIKKGDWEVQTTRFKINKTQGCKYRTGNIESKDSMLFPSKSKRHFYRNRNKVLNFIWNHKMTQRCQSILRKKNAGVITHPAFNIYYNATVSKTIWSWYKETHVDQWNWIESSGGVVKMVE